jgi:V/A-type H+-transporting ATPase subunit A
MVTCTGSDKRIGAISAIGAVSPPGGDISEPVSQATLRLVKVFWCLSANLAYRRHFPAIDWLQSYSLYSSRLREYFNGHVASDWSGLVGRAMNILQEESELEEIVRLVGIDALGPKDRLTLECARSIREDFLHQNSFHEIDTYASLHKQHGMLKLIITWYDRGLSALEKYVPFAKISAMRVLEAIGRAKYAPEAEYKERFAGILNQMTKEFAAMTEGEEDDA